MLQSLLPGYWYESRDGARFEGREGGSKGGGEERGEGPRQPPLPAHALLSQPSRMHREKLEPAATGVSCTLRGCEKAAPFPGKDFALLLAELLHW